MMATAIGWRAHAALTASGGAAKVVAPLSGSFYAEAAGELVWVGPPGTPLHPRAVVVSGVATAPAGAVAHVRLGGVAPWRPTGLDGEVMDRRAAAGGLEALLSRLGEPRGLGRLLLASAVDDLVVMRARPHARALAAGVAGDDAAAVATAARTLLGLGPGLTPSGDDFVGGALFACRLVVRGAAWDAAVARIVADAATLTHRISAQLLADLAAGEGWAPLHDLVVALARRNAPAALVAAHDLTTLGHTSGWDVLAGFSAGLGVGPTA
jgi:hypothetical protein